MKIKTDIDDAKKIGNVVEFAEGDLTYQYLAYRKDITARRDQLWIAKSRNGVDWETEELEGIGMTPRLDMNPQLAVVNESLFLFWMDDSKDKLMATKRAPDPNNPLVYKWYEYVYCLDRNGNEIDEPDDADGAALAVNQQGDSILVSLLYEDKVRYFLFSGNPENYNTGSNEWKAISQSSASIGQVNTLLTSSTKVESFGKRISTTSFTQSPEKTYLVQAMEVEDDDDNDRLLILQLQLQADEKGFGLPARGTSSKLLGNATWWSNEKDKEMNVTRDPGGRVVAAFIDDDDKGRKSLMNTNVFPGTWSGRTRLADFDLDENPVIFYQVGNAEVTKIGDKTAEEMPVTEFYLVQDDDDDTFAISNPYGKIRRIFKYEALNLTEESTSKTLFVQGYIDGPPPVFDGMVNPMAEVNYALTSSSELSFEVVTNVETAIKSEGNLSTEIGTPGPVWDASFNMGIGASFRTANVKSLDENTIFQLQTDGQGNFLNKGLLRSSDIIAARDAYQYIPEGSDVAALDAPEYSRIYLDILPDGKNEYDLGTVTVGDLETYTPAAWNLRMKALYPNVEDYINEIVIPNAVMFKDGQPTVRDTWTSGSPVDGAFQSTTETYLSASITLGASVFAGVSESFLGAEATVMAGFTANVGTTAASLSSNGFGLEMTIDGERGGNVKSYRVSAYLLKASQLWINELIHFQEGQDNGFAIEPNQSCWKIMYVVDQIIYNDLLKSLDLSPEILAELAAENILTTNDLLAQVGVENPQDLLGKVNINPTHKVYIKALIAWDKKRNTHPASAVRSEKTVVMA